MELEHLVVPAHAVRALPEALGGAPVTVGELHAQAVDAREVESRGLAGLVDLGIGKAVDPVGALRIELRAPLLILAVLPDERVHRAEREGLVVLDLLGRDDAGPLAVLVRAHEKRQVRGLRPLRAVELVDVGLEAAKLLVEDGDEQLVAAVAVEIRGLEGHDLDARALDLGVSEGLVLGGGIGIEVEGVLLGDDDLPAGAVEVADDESRRDEGEGGAARAGARRWSSPGRTTCAGCGLPVGGM
ncbi:MAG: hypothetical protein M0D55_01035 [Elusimicrobiota bacterium]|nr:MAG: hypothetical protein M0D55_01035 [Elusimicrobiota bacterium]